MATKIIVTIEDDLHTALKNKTKETGVAYSFIVRRALENWVATGTVPARVAPPGRAEALPAEGNGEE